MTRVVLAAAAALALLAVPADADAAKVERGKRAEIVCFKKTVRVKGRAVRKQVCRARRTAATTPGRFRPAVPPADPSAPAAPPAAPPPLAADVVLPVPAVEVCPDASPWVGATAEDAGGVFRLTLSRACVRAGTVLFDVRNRDLQDHDLWVRSAVVAGQEVVTDVAPGAGGQGSASLAAGQWTLYCSIDGHGSMTRTLTVTPAS